MTLKLSMACALALVSTGLIMGHHGMACTLKMGYRTTEGLPMIAKAPNNSGLYHDLYSRAAERIRCQLQIIREPKKRILGELHEGNIDFYPGLNFTQRRVPHFLYIKNGLPGGKIGLSLQSLPDITDLTQLKGYTYFGALGGTDHLADAGIEGVKTWWIPHFSLRKAVTILRKRRADFTILFRRALYPLRQIKATDIKIHYDCCGGIQPLYLGFSRHSAHYKEEKNPLFDPESPIRIANFPAQLSSDSIAFKFANALNHMERQGETLNLYNQYFFNKGEQQ